MGRECVGRMVSPTYTDQTRKNVCGLGKLNKATLISASSGAHF